MLTEDYIMRMINQALVVLRRILRMKEAGQHQEAVQEIDQVLEQLLGLKSDLIKVLDDESLLESLTQNEQLDVDRLYLVAELMKEEGEILLEMGKVEEGLLSSIRALNFYLEVALDGNLDRFPPPHDRIQELLHRLEGVVLNAETTYPLFCYYEQEKQYSAAEQTLLSMQEDPELVDEVRQAQIAYYERLLQRPEEELTAGGLPIKEILEKLNTMRDNNANNQ
jgi:hypothetical protein